MYTITQAARRAGCRASAIRYYERIGLLEVPRRGTNGYRYYAASDLARLAFVTRARSLGFSIGDVADLLKLADHPNHPCDAVDALLAERLADVRERMAQLARLADELEMLQTACDGGHAIGECGVLAALGQPASASGVK